MAQRKNQSRKSNKKQNQKQNKNKKQNQRQNKKQNKQSGGGFFPDVNAAPIGLRPVIASYNDSNPPQQEAQVMEGGAKGGIGSRERITKIQQSMESLEQKMDQLLEKKCECKCDSCSKSNNKPANNSPKANNSENNLEKNSGNRSIMNNIKKTFTINKNQEGGDGKFGCRQPNWTAECR
jgi:hypothetical protein